MTVGEKIQYYRKQYGLSQDELGQKLLVSRQTISQWENDQTIPTIDNLLRLKEIFGVSVDELLGEEPVSTQQEEDKEKPFEEYTQILTPENFAQMKKYFFSKVTRTLFLSLSAITMISLVYILFNPPEEKPLLSFLVYALCITAILLLFYFLTRFRINKAWKKQNAQLLGATHEYKLYNGYLTVTMYKNSEFSGMAKLYYDKIDKIHDLGELRLLESEGQYYPINLVDFQNSAILNQFVAINPKKIVDVSKEGKWKTLSRFFIILCIFSLIMVPALIVAIIKINFLDSITEPLSFRLTYLLVLLPLSSIVFGIVGLCRKMKTKKNIVIGAIFLAMVLFGCTIFGVANQAFDQGIITEFEGETGYDLPDPVSLDIPDITDDNSFDVYDFPEGESQVGWRCDFEVTEEDAKSFSKEISTDSNWLKEIPKKYYDVFNIDTGFDGCILVFDTQRGEYNKLPSKDGEYVFFVVSFEEKNNSFSLEKYYVNYNAD